MADCEYESDDVEDVSEDEHGDSEDSFIDNDEVVAKKSDFMESRLMEIETNKQKLMTHIKAMARDEFEKLGLTFTYTNISDIFK